MWEAIPPGGRLPLPCLWRRTEAEMTSEAAIGADVTYPNYLHLDQLLALQDPLAPETLGPQVQAAEHFFIVVHQTFELWFKQELLDLECARAALDADELGLALQHVQRATAIHQLLYAQMTLFVQLAPADFLAFRPYLGTASGSESAQFRKVQRVIGLRGEANPLYKAFAGALERAGITLVGLYREGARAGLAYQLAEALVALSESFWQLTAAHVHAAARTIGMRPGTGGTSGVAYLMEALKVKAFPELWEVRTRL
jgi:tryptophan 2,3-dioxygenase